MERYMENEPPMFGQYVKLNTGQIVEFKSFDLETQTVEVKSSTGTIATIGRDEVSNITAHEEMKLLLLRTNLQIRTLPKQQPRV
jgi:hypothetical protein